MGPVTNTTSPFNIASPLFHTIAHYTHGGVAAGVCNICSGARLGPRGNSSSPSSHYTALLPLHSSHCSACATPHSITVRARRASEHYIAPSLQRVTLRYPGMRQGRRYRGWAFLGASLRPPYDVPAILARMAHTQMPSPISDGLTADWTTTT